MVGVRVALEGVVQHRRSAAQSGDVQRGQAAALLLLGRPANASTFARRKHNASLLYLVTF
jgi:hypothetical protein